MSSIAENTVSLREDLPEDVTLVAVSKTRSVNEILESYEVGQRQFGENRPKEMQEKVGQLPKDIHWHFIGHLQTNKVKYIIDEVHLIHSVDSIRLLEEIDKRAGRAERVVDVLLQVHIAEEDQKSGFDAVEVKEFISRSAWQEFTHIRLRGLMGMATFTEDMEVVKKEFGGLRRLFEELIEMEAGRVLGMNILSMGMSGDFKVAIDCGSTMVRVGSRIFGSRNRSDNTTVGHGR